MAVEIAKLGLRSTPFSPPNRSKFPKIFESCRTEKPFTVRLSSSSSSSFIDEQQISFSEPEKVLLERLLGIQGRGRKASPEQLKDVESAVKTLEDLKGVPDPRTFVGVDFFKIFQEVYLRTDDPRVSNIVKLSDAIGELKVEAAATVKDEKRILFRFDKAAFSFKFLPFKVPYPVPFRLLGDEAKGWLDTTYLSHTGNIRISRGNKGTTFVLQKKTEPRQRLLSSISTGIGVKEAIDELISLNPIRAKGEPEALVGEWQLLWSSQNQISCMLQSEAESLLDVAANGLEGLQNFGNYGQVEHLIDVLPGFGLRAIGNFVVSENNTYIVTMAETAFLIGGKFLLPVEVSGKFNLELLYIDNKIRITRGYRRITFVHLRVSEPTKM
ncbi:probable plastid-lipid-associated protein 12, chloroplastic isoform X3 [Magnolia sinica]|uniref:probable plastid-lipid-associated protein 12, chloroplastic isoform X3 n=1 Tax=Magnolia sinica TaxID=86752 RepID=UPI00265A8583|nr:probable plastid-lipid-associated protein 12, chloroplastic isoform X3 [Magnolia sinica]